MTMTRDERSKMEHELNKFNLGAYDIRRPAFEAGFEAGRKYKPTQQLRDSSRQSRRVEPHSHRKHALGYREHAIWQAWMAQR